MDPFKIKEKINIRFMFKLGWKILVFWEIFMEIISNVLKDISFKIGTKLTWRLCKYSQTIIIGMWGKVCDVWNRIEGKRRLTLEISYTLDIPIGSS